ncbi:hypothetical protein M231_06834 [Tremella mesenterica]|uniref:Uncharacterized protein n=1 Tax=Tremella mesenterica TaxID=5217 RepID=A0A4Q1BDH0_TREME|nr:hypothetical protein M231_06834 [Tremella mesenterica]
MALDRQTNDSYISDYPAMIGFPVASTSVDGSSEYDRSLHPYDSSLVPPQPMEIGTDFPYDGPEEGEGPKEEQSSPTGNGHLIQQSSSDDYNTILSLPDQPLITPTRSMPINDAPSHQTSVRVNQVGLERSREQRWSPPSSKRKTLPYQGSRTRTSLPLKYLTPRWNTGAS